MKIIKKLNSFIAKRGRGLFIKEVVIALILLSMPTWFYLTDKVPEKTVYETSWIIVDSDKLGFYNLNMMAWFALLKLIPLIVLILWFFTCKYWWKNAILVPLIFSLSQFIHLLSHESHIDDVEFLFSIIIALPIIVAFAWLASKANAYKSSIRVVDSIKDEVDELICEMKIYNHDESILQHIERFESIKKQKVFLSEENYMYKILKLKNQIILDINKLQ